MNIIIILICLCGDRFFQWDGKTKQFSGFNQYIDVYYTWLFQHVQRANPYFVLLLIGLPLLLVVGGLQMLFTNLFFGLPGFIFNLALLFICLGNTQLQEYFASYFNAKAGGDYATAFASLNTFTQECSQQPQMITRRMTQQIFLVSQRQIIGVLFWFVILGGFGAVLYRLLVQLAAKSETTEDPLYHLHEGIHNSLQVLEWLPIRLTTLFYTLVGNFVQSFGCWLNYLLAAPSDNEQVLLRCGLAALGAGYDDAHAAELDEDIAAAAMVERTVIVFLVLVALMTLAMWLS